MSEIRTSALPRLLASAFSRMDDDAEVRVEIKGKLYTVYGYGMTTRWLEMTAEAKPPVSDGGSDGNN